MKSALNDTSADLIYIQYFEKSKDKDTYEDIVLKISNFFN